VIRLIVILTATDASRRQLRMRFAQAMREAVIRAVLAGRVDLTHAEELWRLLPDPERV
jgi:hypothetical protein